MVYSGRHLGAGHVPIGHCHSVHPHVRHVFCIHLPLLISCCGSLSWVDTAASTIGRLWGRYTPPLPRRLPLVYLPLAPRKSLAGFLAGSLTGVIIAAGFWGSLASIGDVAPVWTWEGGVTGTHIGDAGGVLAGWIGLTVISLVSGIVSGVAEALGTSIR